MEFHINLSKDKGKITSVILVLVILTVLASTISVRGAATRSGRVAPVRSATTTTPPFPYIAEITGDNVNIRSGRGTNYYSCGKLNKGDRVKVVNHQFGWSCIAPPAGSFSWISKQYIGIDPDKPTEGIVTGDGVRVYVGSESIKPIRSTIWQRKLNWGDKVELLGEVKDNYHKIAPPKGVYRWVSTQYTKPVVTAKEVKPPIVKPPITKDAPPITKVVRPKVVVRPDISAEEALKKYYALKTLIEAERVKPIAQQNYANIKKTLTEITESKKAGKAARYAKSALKLVERYEWAFKAEKYVRDQEADLQKILEGIDKSRTIRLAEEVKNLGRFAVIGQFQTFVTYGPGHYRIVDDSDKTICYALPTSSASKMDLSKLVGRKVGLIGEIQPHPETSGAVVRFNAVELQ
jgi:uncharacterized protein YgiM (DUF1202 family)